jgi:hypothetical protein
MRLEQEFNFHISFEIPASFLPLLGHNKKGESAMKSITFLFATLIAGLVLTGCASVAHIEKDETVNFSKYKTYAWAETNEDAGKGLELTERRTRAAVNAELAKEGWREVKNNPDVLISYDLLVERSERQNTNPVYSRSFTRPFFNPYTRRWAMLYYPSQFMGYDDQVRQVREGTLTITMTDAKTDKMVWQGWTTDEVNSKNLTGKEIQSSVRSIFRKFDVAQK